MTNSGSMVSTGKGEWLSMGGEHDLVISQTVLGADGWTDAVDPLEMPALVEALLLAAPGPVTVHELAAASACDPASIEKALDSLGDMPDRGWVVQRHGLRVQLATAPRYAEQVRRLLGFEREARLSAAALETLAIIAYQQPVTRSGIDGVRGVDSSAVLTTLLTRGLIESHNRLDLPGQPYEYSTTPAFLQHFGIRSLNELPPLSSTDGLNLAELLDDSISESEARAPAFEMVGAAIEQSSAGGELANP